MLFKARIGRILIGIVTFLAMLYTAGAQDFTYSNIISTSNNIQVYSLEKVSDGFIVYGDFKGTLNVPGAYSATGRDIFIAKFNDMFELQWVEQIGGTLGDFAYGMTLDEYENMYLIGIYAGTCLFDGGNQLTALGVDNYFDVFVAKYDKNGNFIWRAAAAYNDADQYGTSIDLDKNGDIVIGGYYTDSITFEYASYTASYGMFYAKIDTADGSCTWAKNISSTSDGTQLQSLSAFEDGYYFNGNMKGTVNFDIGAEVSNDPLYTDVFLYKTDFDGDGLWTRRSYGDDDALTGTITSDEYGNVYYTGLFGGTDFEVDSTASLKSDKVLKNNGSSLDMFVLKYNKSGNLIWNQDYGLSGEDWARDLKFQNGFLYITGYFSDTLIFGTDTLLSSSDTDFDAFLGMIDDDGNTLKAIQPIDSDDHTETGMELSSDAANNAYWGGSFKSTTLEIGDSTYTNPNFGKNAVFLAKYEPPYVATFTSKKHVTCYGDTDGELIVTPYFGVLPYTYKWSHDGGLNDSTATGLATGSYTVSVIDAMDDTVTVNYLINQPDTFIFNANITDVTQCSYSANGAIGITVEGGNGGYTYQWFESEGGYGVSLNAEDQSNLSVGKYCVSVTDSKGCSNDTSMYIIGPNPVIFSNSVVTDDSGIDPLHNGAINLELVGGTGTPSTYGAAWSGPGGYTNTVQDISSLAGGNYTVSVTDGASCVFDSTFTVLDLDTLFAYISYKKDDCSGGSADGKATVSYYTPNGIPNIQYSWSPGGQTTASVTGLGVGWHYVTITDLNDGNATSVDSVEIVDLGYTIDGTLTGTTDLDCNGDMDGYIDLTITTPGITPYEYLWTTSDTTQDIVDLGIGTYNVTVTDANECTFIPTQFTISQPTILTATASEKTAVMCYGGYDGVVTVAAGGGNGGLTYLWDDPGAQTTIDADGLDAGYYTVTVTDNKGCQVTSSIRLNEPDELITSGNITDILCKDDASGVIVLNVSGGTPIYSYEWSTVTGSGLAITDKNQSNLSGGAYYVRVEDGNLCEALDTFIVVEPDSIRIIIDSIIDASCYGARDGAAYTSVTGGTISSDYNYSWSNGYGTQDIVDVAGNIYQLTVTDDNTCTAILAPFIISDPPPALVSVMGTDPSCNGVLDGWVEASGTVSNYLWSTGDTIARIENLSSGTYRVTATNSDGCEATGEATILEPDEIIITSTIENVNCNGDSDGSLDITVYGGTVAGDFVFSWATSDGSGLSASAEDQNGLSAGTYNLTVTDDNSCFKAQSLEITEPTVISISNIAYTHVTMEGSSNGTITITASGGTGNLVYTLNPNAIATNQTGIFTGLDAGEYTVNISDQYNCGPITSSTITISETIGIVDIDDQNIIKAYPNPVRDRLYIEITKRMESDVVLEMINVSGQIITSKKIHPSMENTFQIIDVSEFSKGIYFIKLSTESKVYQKQIVIQ